MNYGYRRKKIDMIKKSIFIVIGYEHYNPLGVIRSLGEVGIRPVAIILKGKVKIASSSKYISKLYYVEDYREAYSILMRRYADADKNVFVIPCDDDITSILDMQYDTIKDKFYVSNAAESGKITKYQNKDIISNLAYNSGLDIPKMWHIYNGVLPDNIFYPVITKPLTSYPNWKSDYYICKDEDELKGAIKKINRSDILIQQYINKTKDMSVAGVSINSGIDIFVSNCYSSEYILDDYYSLKNIHSNFKDAALLLSLKKIFKEIGYEGIFSVDFIVDENDVIYFLEVNFRNSAFSYASTKLGMNLPLIWAYSTLYGEFPKNILRNVPDNYVSMAEVQDFWHRVLRLREISIIKWFKEVLRADCLYDWNRHDIYPIITEWVGNIIHFIKTKVKK